MTVKEKAKENAIRFGIIGYGFMGHEHYAMLSKTEGIRVVAVADIDEKQLQGIPVGVKIYHNPDDLIHSDEVDVVLVAANNNQHHALVIKAANAGKNILCEKPAAMTVQELDEMEEACKLNGVKFTVHHQRRYDQDFQTIKNIYDAKTLGEIYSIKTSIYGFNGNMHDWHIYIKEGGGMLFDWGVHLIDQMLYMVSGKVKTVFADVRNVINSEVDDYFKILLRFENGVLGEIELGTYFLADREQWFERHWFMAGDKGTAYTDGFHPKAKICSTTRLLTNAGGARTMTAAGPTRSFGPPPDGVLTIEDVAPAETTHQDFFTNYINAYHGKEAFMVQIPQVRRVLALMEAIRESAKLGKSVDFE